MEQGSDRASGLAGDDAPVAGELRRVAAQDEVATAITPVVFVGGGGSWGGCPREDRERR